MWRPQELLRGKRQGDRGLRRFRPDGQLVFGRPAAQAVADLARRAGAERIFLTADGTPNQETEEVVTAMTASRLRYA